MEAILNILPLHLLVQGAVRLPAYRLQVNGFWKFVPLLHSLIISVIKNVYMYLTQAVQEAVQVVVAITLVTV